jgi:hypothetical protein
MITAEQFAEWKTHPVTIEIFEELDKMKKGLVENMVAGSTLSRDPGNTQGLTNRMVGQIDGLNQLLNISFEDAEEKPQQDEISGY